MRALVMMDSFKGSLTSTQANKIIAAVLKKKKIKATTVAVSDGGDGFLEAMTDVLHLANKSILVKDPLFRDRIAQYGYDSDNKTAYIELAQAAGLHLLALEERNPLAATSYGVGQLIGDAIDMGCTKIVLGIGGSATHDCGSGMLEAMGLRFFDQNDKILYGMNGKKLKEVVRINDTEFRKKIKDIEFLTLCDVKNALLGPEGAAYTFAKQKGATQAMVHELEENSEHFCYVANSMKLAYPMMPGSGAAGGVGFACQFFMKAKLTSGIDYILDYLHFDKLILDTDLLVTGEGKIDQQSVFGKAPFGIYKRRKNKKVVMICGVLELSPENYKDIAFFSIVPTIASLAESLEKPDESLKRCCEKINFEKIG